MRKYANFEGLTNTMLNEFVYKILVHERDIKGSVDSPQTIEFYFNFIGKFETPATEQGPTPEEILLMEKRQKIREKRHEAYLRRKSTGWQATYYWKNKRARKEKMDAAKEAIRAEDQAKISCYILKLRTFENATFQLR